MNFLYILNYFMIGILVALASVEVSLAFFYLLSKKRSNFFEGGIKHIWGVVTSFAVFLVVNFEATYPRLLPQFATLYETPLLIFAILLLVKNSSVTYSYGLKDKRKANLMKKVYALATVISSFLLISILTSSLNSDSIVFSSGKIGFWGMLFNPLGIISFVMVGLVSVWVLFSKRSKFIGPGLLVILTLLTGILNYPYAFNRGVNLLNEIATSPAIIISTVIVAALGYALLLGVYLLERKLRKAPEN